MCETFFSSLKEEWKVELKVKTFDELEKVIKEYINFYNYERIRIKTSAPPIRHCLNNLNKIKVTYLNEVTL